MSDERPSIVFKPSKSLGLVIHRDGRIRFQRLGVNITEPPKFTVEPFDGVTDKSVSTMLVASEVKRHFDDSWAFGDAVEVISELLERALDFCRHPSFVTKGGTLVCMEEDCVYARAWALVLEDYESARGVPEGSAEGKRRVEVASKKAQAEWQAEWQAQEQKRAAKQP